MTNHKLYLPSFTALSNGHLRLDTIDGSGRYLQRGRGGADARKREHETIELIKNVRHRSIIQLMTNGSWEAQRGSCPLPQCYSHLY